METLQGRRVRLRPTTHADLGFLQTLWNDGEVMRYVGYPQGLGIDGRGMREWFARLERHRGVDHEHWIHPHHRSRPDRDPLPCGGPDWEAQRICFEFVLRGAVLLVPSSRECLSRVAALMEKYRDLPMDFADATLVALGEEVGTNWVFTLDRRGFSTYRLRGRRPFRILPAGSA